MRDPGCFLSQERKKPESRVCTAPFRHGTAKTRGHARRQLARNFSHILSRRSSTHYLSGMCGRVRLSTDYSETKIKVKFDAAYPAPNIPASWNVCPTDPMLVAVRSEDGRRIPQQM